jgi:hypothetical protein
LAGFSRLKPGRISVCRPAWKLHCKLRTGNNIDNPISHL